LVRGDFELFKVSLESRLPLADKKIILTGLKNTSQ
jgi:hypothetical protein